MANITRQDLQKQVNAYKKVKGDYEIIAETLRHILDADCKKYFPIALVQARAKAIPSFAEKVVRKAGKYKDAVNQLTDLCGARIIVQTLDQVDALREYIRANFEVLEEDDKGAKLAEDVFGYGDVHFIVKVPTDKIPKEAVIQCKKLGKKSLSSAFKKNTQGMEIQIRTWGQHAIADPLHDRLYKTPLKNQREPKRLANMLNAIRENNDRLLNELCRYIDRRVANYGAYANEGKVREEIDQLSMLKSTPGDKVALAVRLARLHRALGDYTAATAEFKGLNVSGDLIALSELGHDLCRANWEKPNAGGFKDGVRKLQDAVTLFQKGGKEKLAIPRDPERDKADEARALSWLAKALDKAGNWSEAQKHYAAALEREPDNPYYLADAIGAEFRNGDRDEVSLAEKSGVRDALKTCHGHIEEGTEMPYAAFASGRLHALLGEEDEALADYALGIAVFRSKKVCSPPLILEKEINWLGGIKDRLVRKGKSTIQPFDWCLRMLKLAKGETDTKKDNPPIAVPVLVLAGGAASLSKQDVDKLLPVYRTAFTGFNGTVVSGGTDVGIPRLAGDVAKKWNLNLRGYLPPRITPYAPYAGKTVVCGTPAVFSTEQIIKGWEDIVVAGITPTAVGLIGFAGGKLSAIEYRIAVALGASVGLVRDSGGSASALLADGNWSGFKNLLALPLDASALRVFVFSSDQTSPLDATLLDQLAAVVHQNFVTKYPNYADNCQPWDKLNDTYKDANRDQVRWMATLLRWRGWSVRKAKKPILAKLPPADIEFMAELEHGRWMNERLLDGWKYGPERDNALKIQPLLLPWNDKRLKEPIKDKDRNAVRDFPSVLAMAGLEIYKP